MIERNEQDIAQTAAFLRRLTLRRLRRRALGADPIDARELHDDYMRAWCAYHPDATQAEIDAEASDLAEDWGR